jgi:hypothetical protein
MNRLMGKTDIYNCEGADSESTQESQTPLLLENMQVLPNQSKAVNHMWANMFVRSKTRSSDLAKRRRDVLRDMADVENDVHANDIDLIERGREIMDDDGFMEIMSKLADAKARGA